MEALPVELLRLIFAECEPESVRSLREMNRTLANVGYEYLLPPKFTALSYRNDIDRLHNIALHDRLRGSIESITINLSDISDYDARNTAFFQHFSQFPDERHGALDVAWEGLQKIAAGRKTLGQLYAKRDDLRDAFSRLPNLKEVEVDFTRCPLNNEVLQEVYGFPSCRRLDRSMACDNLDAVIFAINSAQVHLDSFSCDRFPIEIFKITHHRKHWFMHARSFESLSRLNLTLDPSALPGFGSAIKAVNGLGYLLHLCTQLEHLKLAFHPYSSSDSKFLLSFREMLDGFTFTKLKDLTLECVSCEEDDLKAFLARHGSTLTHLRLGGRGLAKPYERSLGGIHLYEGTFKSLFTGLHTRLPRLERLHLEGVFECDHGLTSHESYNFYPLTNEDWEEVPKPSWVRRSRLTISCSPFEYYVLHGGPYPGSQLAQPQY